MELLKNEKELYRTSSLIVTNNSLMQVKNFNGEVVYKEIPLNKIDGIYCDSRKNFKLTLLGVVLLILGFLLINNKVQILFYITSILGLLLIFLGMYLKFNYVEISAGNFKISEKVKDLDELVDVIRKEIYDSKKLK
jgi:hypothetical protein